MNGITVSKKIIMSFALLIVMFLGFGAFACYSGQKLHATVVDLVGWTDNLAVVANVADAASAEPCAISSSVSPVCTRARA